MACLARMLRSSYVSSSGYWLRVASRSRRWAGVEYAASSRSSSQRCLCASQRVRTASHQQQARVADRAEAQADRDALATESLGTDELDERIGELDQQITDAGIRGNVLPARARRHRSTRRRHDAAPLPRRPVSTRTIGKTYTAPDGTTFRPSMFVTLTCPSYGRVCEDGAPADPDAYDYHRAARDALHFAALFDRFIQNLRRFTGHDLQYFAAIEPQRRLAPHVHIAIRGTISRTELRQVIAATYHQVWWPSTQAVKYDGGGLPVWDDHTSTYLDPDTGEPLPTWDQALDAIGDHDEPATWPGSATDSTPRACSPDRGTPAGASATSPST